MYKGNNLKFIPQKIPEVVLIEPIIKEDNRGYFLETYRKDLFEKNIGAQINFIQDNESKSSYGVLRGLHFQKPPFEQTKLVRVIKGEVLDVAVDLRKNRSTFGQWKSIVLSGENKRQLLIPKGFAHGFIVLSDYATVSYKVDNAYAPDHESGILWNDNQLNIDWGINGQKILVTKKDENLLSFT